LLSRKSSYEAEILLARLLEPVRKRIAFFIMLHKTTRLKEEIIYPFFQLFPTEFNFFQPFFRRFIQAELIV